MHRTICITLGCLLIFGCSQGPDFSKPSIVTGKEVNAKGVALYELDYRNGVRGKGWGEVYIKAPQAFAEVGDVLEIKNGSLVVSKKMSGTMPHSN